jgi:hypothetical protein
MGAGVNWRRREVEKKQLAPQFVILSEAAAQSEDPYLSTDLAEHYGEILFL